MLNLTFAIIIGGIFSYSASRLGFADPLFMEGTLGSYFEIVSLVKWFLLGAWLSTIVRFVGPKRVVNITLLGTKPIQEIKTGIGITLPQPFGWTHSVVHTDIQSSPININTMSKDKQNYGLEANAQWVVDEAKVPNAPRLFAFERDNAEQQVVHIITAALISGTNGMVLEKVFEDKAELQQHVMDVAGPTLETFGVTLVDLFIEDPKLRDTTIAKLAAIREAEYDKEAATNEAEATFIRMVGHARAEAESTRLKGAALANFRMLIAEGNAAAIALMQGKVAVEWVDETVGDGDEAQTVKKAKFVTPEQHAKEGEAPIPQIEIDPAVVLEFFKVVDGNDAIRDASSKPGTTVVIPSSVGGGDSAIPAALLGRMDEMMSNVRAPRPANTGEGAQEAA